MPTPNKGESKVDYISRCMGSTEARSDFPDSKQRAAFCHSEWEILMKTEQAAAPDSGDHELVKLTEYVQSQVSMKKNVIEGALLCGIKSKNGYSYSQTALLKAVPLYENVPVYIDHGGGKQRDAADRWGIVHEARMSPEGIRGDIHYMESHPMTARIEEQLRTEPMFGMSHDAAGVMRKDIVEEIKDVHALCVVSEPATTKSLTEQKPVVQLTEQQTVDLKEQVDNLKEQVGSLKEEITRLHDLRWTAPRVPQPLTEQTLSQDDFNKIFKG